MECESFVVNASIADHLPVMSYLYPISTKTTKKKNNIKYQDELNLDETVNCLKAHDWSVWIEKHKNATADETFHNLHNIITDTINSNTTKIEIKKRNCPKTPWISQSTIRKRLQCNKLRKKFMRNKSPQTYELMVNSTKDYKSSIKKDKNNYYNKELELAKNNSKKIWQIINDITNRKNKSTNEFPMLIHNGINHKTPKEVVEAFNDYYVNIATTIANKIEEPKKDFKFYLHKTLPPNIDLTLPQSTNIDILKIATSFKNKSSAGHDKISNKLLKQLLPSVIDPITFSINKSITAGKFPETIKTSKITPIYKKGEPTDPSNYRPISQLSSFSKLYEKTFAKTLNKFHTETDMLGINQFGFKAGHSTNHALIQTINKIQLEKNRGHYSILVSLDLSKAFDTLNTTEILPEKLKYYYNNKTASKWLLSFFNGRKQYVSIHNTNSNIINNKDISCVQGSTLGPIIYSLYCADLPNITSLFSVLFADDCNLIISGQNLQNLEKKLNTELEKIKDYMQANKLTLNTGKTVALIFQPPQKKAAVSNLNLLIGNQKIDIKNETKYLGVIIDTKLKFETHFKKVLEKVKNGARSIALTKRTLNYSAKIKLYYAMIHSHITYCPLIWLANQPQKNMKLLTILQKKALRAIFNTNYNSHTENLYYISGIEKIENICPKENIWIMYQYKNNDLPKAITQMINSSLNTNPAKTLRSSSKSLNIRAKTFPGDILYGLINTWNMSTCKVKDRNYPKKTCKDLIKMHLSNLTATKTCVPSCMNCKQTESYSRNFKYKFNKHQKK